MLRRLQIPGIKEHPHLRARYLAEVDAAVLSASIRGCAGDCGGAVARITAKYVKLVGEAGKKQK